ncbi:MAG: hypothetical protein ABIM17_02310 [candidate division WOR-3 bacterium]
MQYYIVPSYHRKIQVRKLEKKALSKDEAFLSLAGHILKGNPKPLVLFSDQDKTLDFLFLNICLESSGIQLNSFFSEENEDIFTKSTLISLSREISNTIKYIILYGKAREFETIMNSQQKWRELVQKIKSQETIETLQLLWKCYESYRKKENEFKNSSTYQGYFFTTLSAVEELYLHLKNNDFKEEIKVEYEDIPEFGLYEPIYVEILKLLRAKLIDRTKNKNFPPIFKAFSTIVDETAFILDEISMLRKLKEFKEAKDPIALLTYNTDLLSTLKVVSTVQSKRILSEETLGEESYFYDFLNNYESHADPRVTPKNYIRNTEIPSKLSKFKNLLDSIDNAVNYIASNSELIKPISLHLLKQNRVLSLRTSRPFLIARKPADIVTCDLKKVYICGLYAYGDFHTDFWLPDPLQEELKLKNSEIYKKTTDLLEYISTKFPTTISYSHLLFGGDNVVGVSNFYIYFREKMKKQYGNQPNFQDTEKGVFLTHSLSNFRTPSLADHPSNTTWCSLDLLPNVKEIHIPVPELLFMFACPSYAVLKLSAQKVNFKGEIHLKDTFKILSNYILMTPIISYIKNELGKGQEIKDAFRDLLDKQIPAKKFSNNKKPYRIKLLEDLKENLSQDQQLASSLTSFFKDHTVIKIKQKVPDKEIYFVIHNLIKETVRDTTKVVQILSFLTVDDLKKVASELPENRERLEIYYTMKFAEKVGVLKTLEDISRIGLAYRYYKGKNTKENIEFRLVTLSKDLKEEEISEDILKKFDNFVSEKLNDLFKKLTMQINDSTSKTFSQSCPLISCSFWRNCKIFLLYQVEVGRK